MHDTIGKETFNACINEIYQISLTINDKWILVNKDTENSYIKMELLCSNKINNLSEDDVDLELTESESQDLSATFNYKNSLCKWEYHVVFNENYGVPMLCLNVWKCGGQLLTLKEMWSILNLDCNESDLLSVLTQMDHPILQTPFFTLHPCKTSNILEIFQNKTANPVISWLSSVGPIVSLYLPLEYGKATLKKDNYKNL